MAIKIMAARKIFIFKYLSTIKLVRRQQIWVCTKPHYCQLIRENIVDKYLKWCQEQLTNEEDFFHYNIYG